MYPLNIFTDFVIMGDQVHTQGAVLDGIEMLGQLIYTKLIGVVSPVIVLQNDIDDFCDICPLFFFNISITNLFK